MTPLDLFLYILAALGGIGVSCIGSLALLVGLVVAVVAITDADHLRARKRLDAELAAVGEER